MGKKKKGKKKKKVEEAPKEPSPYEKWSLEEMQDELVKLKALATQLEVCGADGAAARHGDRPH